jgi:hypothetical protein
MNSSILLYIDDDWSLSGPHYEILYGAGKVKNLKTLDLCKFIRKMPLRAFWSVHLPTFWLDVHAWHIQVCFFLFLFFLFFFFFNFLKILN